MNEYTDLPSGWRYGFPKTYQPLPGETLEQALLRDGYPQREIDNGGARHCRFIGGAPSMESAANDDAARAAVEGAQGQDHLPAANENLAESNPSWIAPRFGDWMQTYTGRAVYPLDLRPEDIDVRDIAHSLAMQCRYAGHVRRFYSVAEHSVHVARHCRQYGPEAALEGLLHDATEAYLVDVPRPIKPFLKSYKLMEQRAAEAVADRFGLDPYDHPEAVHEADNRILHDERAALMAPCEREWSLTGEPLGVTIECWSPERAEREFLALFDELYGED